jgi:hypothetical protein
MLRADFESCVSTGWATTWRIREGARGSGKRVINVQDDGRNTVKGSSSLHG